MKQEQMFNHTSGAYGVSKNGNLSVFWRDRCFGLETGPHHIIIIESLLKMVPNTAKSGEWHS